MFPFLCKNKRITNLETWFACDGGTSFYFLGRALDVRIVGTLCQANSAPIHTLLAHNNVYLTREPDFLETLFDTLIQKT